MATQTTKKGQKLITIRLKKGLMGTSDTQRKTVTGLGLKRKDDERSLENTPSVRGMIKKVIHLLDIVSEG